MLLVKKRKDQTEEDRPNISHPYPPSYRSNPSPDQSSSSEHLHLPSGSGSQVHGLGQGYGNGNGIGYGYDPRSMRAGSSPQSLLPITSEPHRSRSPSDPTIPLTAGLARGVEGDKELSSSSTATGFGSGGTAGGTARVDSEGIELPDGWTKEDEEAEREFLRKGLFDWKALMGWRYWIRKEWWGWYLAAIILSVLVALMTIFHDQIVGWLTPMTNWMKDLPAGWTIPIAILFVLSFPPLFGQEIVAILVGVVWGLWIGFGIVAAGTFAGEFGNFYAFKYCLRSTAEKYERKNLNYACMAHIVREGGFWIVFVSRLSAIPGHFTTAVFATCGTGIWVFSIATILTLPKQLVVVYLGVIFKEAGEGKQDSRSKIISAVVLVVGFLVTIYAAWYIYRQMHKARVVVWRQRRVASKEKGLSSDPVMAEIGGAKGYTEQELKEIQSPILQNQDRMNPHQSYQNPYDIRYQSRDNMSFYEVEGPVIRPNEQDMGYGYGMPNHSTETMFPTPRPSGNPTGLRREPTAASMYAQESRPEVPDYANFPVPSPVPSVGVAK